MPQFDLYCFSTQVFWVVVIFFVFYVVFTQIFLADMGSTLKLRAKRKNLTLESAGKQLPPFSLYISYLLA
jgi:F0F1-type ATP synthase membrane subunit b/b'